MPHCCAWSSGRWTFWSIERSGTYRGRFPRARRNDFPLDGVEPEDLRIAGLEKRLVQEPIKEVVIALSMNVEGDATMVITSPGRLARPGLEDFPHRLWPAGGHRTGICR